MRVGVMKVTYNFSNNRKIENVFVTTFKNICVGVTVHLIQQIIIMIITLNKFSKHKQNTASSGDTRFLCAISKFHIWCYKVNVEVTL
jgi:hypothetical protein